MQRFAAAMGAAIVLAASVSGPALAQYAIGDGVNMYSGGTSGLTGYTTLDLGSTPGTATMPMPMSIAYGDTSIAVSLQATGGNWSGGGLVAGDNMYAPTAGQNFLWAHNANITLAFASAQNYFAANWGFVSSNDTFSFYNGGTLLGQVTGAQYMAMTGAAGGYGNTENVEFQFTEIGYDRVVVSASGDLGVEVGALRVGDASAAVDVAPAPVGAGGLIAFLAMMGARRRGLTWKQALREASVYRRAPHGQTA